MIKFIDLFAGIGGFRLGLEKANKEYKCVYTNEWDKYASSIYKKHYGECDTTDITKVKAKDIPDHDLLCAGFPCQSFSIAGKRRGFEDTRGTLFFDIARILSEKRPRLVLLENVKGLLNHDKGKTFQTILGVLSDLGYECEWQVLNSKHFGVPQNRERVFIVGHLGGYGGGQVFPIGKTNWKDVQKGTKESGRRSWVSTLDSRYGQRWSSETYVRTDEQDSQKIKDKSDSTNNIRRTSYTDGARIRRLTPTECERLQGFPEVEKDGIIQVCLDHQKSYVNAEAKSLKLQKPAGSVEKTESKGNVKSVAKDINTKHQRIDKLVQPDVLINCEENGVQIRSQGKLLLNAKGAEKKNWSHQHIEIDDFVQMLVGLNTMLENATKHGEEELHPKEGCLIAQKNGKKLARVFGNETMQPVGDVENDLIILKELLKYTTLDHLNTKISEQRLITLSSFVTRVIIGYIPQKMLNQDTFTIKVNAKVGYTFGISDTQRYKCLGNAVTTNVITAIGGALLQTE